jgi:hypothetical protein
MIECSNSLKGWEEGIFVQCKMAGPARNDNEKEGSDIGLFNFNICTVVWLVC